MLYIPTLISIIEVLLVTALFLLTVAFVTVATRKIMASMQKRLGSNLVGYYNYLQSIRIINYLYSKRFNISLSLVGLFTLLWPLKVFFHMLGIMDYFPLVSAIYSVFFTAFSLLSKEKDLPGKLGFMYIFTYSLFMSLCIRQGYVPDLLLSFITSSGLLAFFSNYINVQSKIVLYANNEVPSTNGQQQHHNYNDINQPTSHDPSLNITSQNDKYRVEAIYSNEERHFNDCKSGLRCAVTSFTTYWNKTKDATEDVGVSYDEMLNRIEEARKKCDLMETRLNATLYHQNKATDASNSLREWDIRHGVNPDKSRWNWILKERHNVSIETARKELEEFRDPARGYNQN